MIKRLFDLVASAVALVLFAPVLGLVAVAVMVDSGRPVLFRQTRVGRDARPFDIVKFRSMRTDAELSGPAFTIAGDNRVTRVGGVLRRLSLDELPQLWNVLRGEMSLVGPRPDLPAQRSNYTEAQWRERCSVRPGITGLAQALYRSESTERERLDADLRYVRESSLALDARIVAMTIRRLAGRGSN